MSDFDQIINRTKTNSIKWHVAKNELPMWIADMDFKTSPAIVQALQEKVRDGIFGYEEIPPAYFNAVANWYERVHGFRPDPAWMTFATGVVPALSSAVRRLTAVGDNVLVQAPVYNIFYNSIVNNGRHVVSSDLLYDENKHVYHVDWDDLEAKLSDPLTNMMILCNPHNPIGLIWSRETLTRLGQLCQQYHVKIFSDEIHGDLTFNQTGYTPMFSLPAELIQNLVAAVSPSKTFNVAAMHAATVLVPNKNLRAQINRGLNSEELAEPNLVAIPGTIAAYEKGLPWLQELKEYLVENRELVRNFISQEVGPRVALVEGQATYLIWIDVSQVTNDSAKLAKFIRKETGLILSAGSVYGGNGNHFLRMNVACPKERLQDGLQRLKKGLTAWQAQAKRCM
ncbi:putative C-S lyase [Pediococcus acidilactici]|nr:putative C-S lyase [Pediococcus acidilactici]UWF33625.1 pyridoxal phosphate-dependent aminotransferase [Pediococcus acidilactici]